MPILMRSGVVDREMITWKMSHCRSPWMKISLEGEKMGRETEQMSEKGCCKTQRKGEQA